MKQCAIPKLIEKQQSLLCGKDAINNLLQQKIADCNKLKTVSKYIVFREGWSLPEVLKRCLGVGWLPFYHLGCN